MEEGGEKLETDAVVYCELGELRWELRRLEC